MPDAGGPVARATLWSSPTSRLLLVVALDASEVVAHIGRAGRLRERVLAAVTTGSRDDVTCLYVTRGPTDARAIDRAIMVRGATADVRLISWNALSRLAELVTGGTLTHAEALAVLRPAVARADETVAALAARPAQPEAPPVAAALSCPQCGWTSIAAAITPGDLGGDHVYLHCRECGHLWPIKERRARR